jgi:hypothetical protein
MRTDNYPTAKIFADGTRVDYTPEYWRAKEKPSSVVRTTQARQPSFPSIRKWKVVNPKEASYESGVYVIMVDSERFGDNNVAYIGESFCLARRLRCHEVIRRLVREGYAPSVRIYPTEHRFNIEERLIWRHKPVFNKHHKA